MYLLSLIGTPPGYSRLTRLHVCDLTDFMFFELLMIFFVLVLVKSIFETKITKLRYTLLQTKETSSLIEEAIDEERSRNRDHEENCPITKESSKKFVTWLDDSNALKDVDPKVLANSILQGSKASLKVNFLLKTNQSLNRLLKLRANNSSSVEMMGKGLSGDLQENFLDEDLFKAVSKSSFKTESDNSLKENIMKHATKGTSKETIKTDLRECSNSSKDLLPEKKTHSKSETTHSTVTFKTINSRSNVSTKISPPPKPNAKEGNDYMSCEPLSQANKPVGYGSIKKNFFQKKSLISPASIKEETIKQSKIPYNSRCKN